MIRFRTHESDYSDHEYFDEDYEDDLQDFAISSDEDSEVFLYKYSTQQNQSVSEGEENANSLQQVLAAHTQACNLHVAAIDSDNEEPGMSGLLIFV